MKEITLQLDPAVILFYSRIAAVTGCDLEQILSDALFKLAGELSLQALQNTNNFLSIDISDSN